jgi:putative aldouronate transport system permease protein
MKKTKGDRIFDTCNYLVRTLLCVVCLYPLLHVVFASFSLADRLIAHKGFLLGPLGFTLDGYKAVFGDASILRGYLNTIVYTTLGVGINMVMTILGAYTLSRRALLWKKPIMLIITITMFFSGGLIPWFLVVKSLGMYNNLAAMLFPTALNTWNMIIMRTGFQGIPQDLEEAAQIDGANDAFILIHIILHLSKAVLAVIFLYYFVGSWNSWFNAMVLLQDRKMFPLQLLLREILVMNDMSATASTGMGVSLVGGQVSTAYRELVKYCTIVVATFPIMCIYPFLQKYFVKGIYVGSLKG